MKIHFALFLLFAPTFQAQAGVAPISTTLDSVAIIATAFGGHLPGNMEIKIANGTPPPSGLTCDATYITTRNTVTGFKDMLSVLLTAQATQKPVFLWVTDDAQLNAYPGRCSLIGVTLGK